MKTICKTLKQHWGLVICLLLFSSLFLPLSPLGYEYMIGFTREPFDWNNYFSNWYSLILTIAIALVVYLRVDKRTSKKIDTIKGIEEDIQENTKKISEITERMQNNVDKIYFQTERSIALNKYPDREEFRKINNSYQPFIFSAFREELTTIDIIVQIKPNEELVYKVELIKDDITSIPKLYTSHFYKFYIIKIISPAYPEVLKDEQLNEYKYSPIKEGEYYGCRFDERKCSWILGERLELGREYEDGFYQFYITGSVSEFKKTRSANEVMGYDRNSYPGNKYSLINGFIIEPDKHPRDIINIFKKNNQIFFKIGNSPLKKIYVLKKFAHGKMETFLVFEYLRGYIKSANFIENLKNIILEKINIEDLPIIDYLDYEYNYRIKTPIKIT